MYHAGPINAFYEPRITVEEGKATVEIDIAPKLFHSAGATHGAVYFKVLDDAAFFAANSLEHNMFVLTTSFTTYLMRPISVGTLTAVGRVVNRTRSQFLAEAVAYDSDGNEVGRGNGIFVRSRIPLEGIDGYGGPRFRHFRQVQEDRCGVLFVEHVRLAPATFQAHAVGDRVVANHVYNETAAKELRIGLDPMRFGVRKRTAPTGIHAAVRTHQIAPDVGHAAGHRGLPKASPRRLHRIVLRRVSRGFTDAKTIFRERRLVRYSFQSGYVDLVRGSVVFIACII